MSNRRMLRAALLSLLAVSPVLAKDKVEKARAAQSKNLQTLFKEKGASYPPDELYLRAFKTEKLLEVWAGPKGKPLTLIKTYKICAASGDLGPKREQGDLQVPEGFYEIKSFNPFSSYHLSMEISYPNASDRVLGTKGNLGGAIYLHGSCASIGCIAIEDAPIEEVYLMTFDAKTKPVRIDIFPKRLDAEGLASLSGSHLEFWKTLAPGYQQFEENHRPAKVKTDPKTGSYSVAPVSTAKR